MNSAQITKAIEYNKRQGYDTDEVKLIQEVTGSTPDGIWGPRTVRAIADWQKEQGLAVDGMVGPKTFAAIIDHDECPDYEALGEVTKPSKVIIGAWGDDPPRMMASASYIQKLHDHGISEVALMMNRANISKNAEPWDLRWSDRGEEGWHDDEIGEIGEAYAKAGIGIILTTWPLPQKAQIDAMCEDMVGLLKITKAKAFEVDTEGNWLTKRLEGFASMDDAAEYLVASMRSALVAAGIPNGITESTTFAHHADLSRFPAVAPRVDRVAVQAYSTSPRSSGPVAWDSYLGPGRHQEWALNRTRNAGAKEVVMGLAAYKQRGFKGRSPTEAMSVAYDKTIELGVHHVRYWSTKWIVGVQSKNAPYAGAFLRKIATQTA